MPRSVQQAGNRVSAVYLALTLLLPLVLVATTFLRVLRPAGQNVFQTNLSSVFGQGSIQRLVQNLYPDDRHVGQPQGNVAIQ